MTDLSPRTRPEPVAPAAKSRRRWMSIVVLCIVLVAGGVIVTQFLRSAVDYYCNVDEVGHKSGCEVGRRLRIQGTVDEGSVEKNGAVTDFRITFNGVTREVHYEGDPGGLFQECIPVVVHGTLDAAGVFDGDKLEVKHTNEYAAKNPDRLDPTKSAACSQAQA